MSLVTTMSLLSLPRTADNQPFHPYTLTPLPKLETMRLRKQFDLSLIVPTKAPACRRLNCAQFDPLKSTLTVSDGRMLARVPVSGDGGCESHTKSLIPRQALVESRKGSKRLGTETSSIWIYPETVKIESAPGSVVTIPFAQEVRSGFPKVDDVIPSQAAIREVPSERRVRVNAKFLVKLLKALGTPSEVEIILGAGEQKAAPLVLQSYSESTPEELTGALGLLMPIREP